MCGGGQKRRVQKKTTRAKIRRRRRQRSTFKNLMNQMLNGCDIRIITNFVPDKKNEPCEFSTLKSDMSRQNSMRLYEKQLKRERFFKEEWMSSI